MMNTNTRNALNTIQELVEQMNNIIENILPELEIEADDAYARYEESNEHLAAAETNPAITNAEYDNMAEENDELYKVNEGYEYLIEVLERLHTTTEIDGDELLACLTNYLA